MPPVTNYQILSAAVLDEAHILACIRWGVGLVLTEPSSKAVLIFIVLQTRLVEEETLRAIPGVDGDEVPLWVEHQYQCRCSSETSSISERRLTRIVIKNIHVQAPWEIRAIVELLVSAVQEADRGDLDGFECHVVLAGASVIGTNVEAILFLVSVAFNACLEVVAAWWSDGSVCGQVDR